MTVDGARGVPTHTPRLDGLVEQAFCLQAEATSAHPEILVSPAVPVLFFGDESAYRDSEVRVVTVGLNPSRLEFPAASPWLRFPEAEYTDDPTAAPQYLTALREYFRRAPYDQWFGHYDRVLTGMGAGYYPGWPSTAVHTDVCSPLATDPTWSGLGPGVQALLAAGGRKLWLDLVYELAPDVVLASVGRTHLEALRPVLTGPWRELTTIDRAPPFIVRQAEGELNGRRVLVVAGDGFRGRPFGKLSSAERHQVGQAILARLTAMEGA